MYDLTVGYPDLLPQSEMDALRGIFPKNVHFHIKRLFLIHFCNNLKINLKFTDIN